MRIRVSIALAVVALLTCNVAIAQNKREQQVRQDHTAYADDESWNYGDLQQAFRIAGNEKKPLLVVFRCIP